MIQTEKPSNLLDRLRARLVTKPDRGLVYIDTNSRASVPATE